VDSVELASMLRNVFQSVSLHELKRIPWLGIQIHSNYLIESRPVVTHRCATSPAE
jgi:hypothetical protein